MKFLFSDRKTVVTFAIITLLAVILFAGYFVVAGPNSKSTHSSAAPSQSSSNIASATRTEAGRLALKTSKHPATSSSVNPILTELIQSRDYAAFFEKYRATPGGDGKILAANLLDNCINYYPGAPSLIRLNERADQMSAQQKIKAKSAINELSSRCRNFVPAHFADRNLWVGMRHQARDANDPAGLVHHMDEPEVYTKTNVMELAPTLAQTGDPVVIDELALFFSRSGGAIGWQIETLPTPASNVEMYWAWKLAACDLSANCGPGSLTLLDACAAGYGCDYASLEDIARASLLSPAAFDRINKIRNAVTYGVLTGEWPAGFWRPKKRE